MMLNDADVWNISDIDKIPQQDDSYNPVRISITIPYYLAKALSVSYASNNEIMKNMIEAHIERLELQHHTASLLFDNREPRRDVLLHLLEIAKTLGSDPEFPDFYPKRLEYQIRATLENPDPRTLKKYMNCIKRFAELSSGTGVGPYRPYNLFYLKDAVLAKLESNSCK